MSLTEWRSRPVADTLQFARSFVDTFRTAHVPFLAGGIAYAAFVSLLPALVLAVLVAGLVGGQAFVDAVLGLTEAYLSPTGQNLLAGALAKATGQAGLSALSAAVLLWATVRLFRTLDLAFSLLYGTASSTGVVDQVVDGVVVIVAAGLAIAGMVSASLLFTLAPGLAVPRVLDEAVLVVFLTVTLLPVYYVFPDRDLSVRTVLPGALVAAVGWTVLEAAFSLYVGLSGAAELYGVIGGIILLVTWLYFGSLWLLVGATVNVVFAGIDPGAVDPDQGGR